MFDRDQLQILYNHIDHTRFHIVEMGCQMVQLLPAYIVGPTMFVNLTPALGSGWVKTLVRLNGDGNEQMQPTKTDLGCVPSELLSLIRC